VDGGKLSDLRYFFILGTPRSGTTLLQSMLMRGSGVVIPPETHFIHVLWERRDQIDLETDEGWDLARGAVLARNETSEIEMDLARFDEILAGGPRTYGTLFRAWLGGIAALHPGARMLGEKSTDHVEHVLELLAIVPGAKFVQIVRDPRDVALSHHQVWGRTVLQTAVRWRRDVEAARDYERLLSPGQFRLIRYDDLVTRTRGTLGQVCEMLGIEFRDVMLHPGGRRVRGFASDEKHKFRTLKRVTTERIGRFRREMKPMDVATVERVCGPQLEELGWEREHKSNLLGNLGVGLRAPTTVVRRALRKRRIEAKIEAGARRMAQGD